MRHEVKLPEWTCPDELDAVLDEMFERLGRGQDKAAFIAWVNAQQKPKPAVLMYHAFEQGMHAGYQGANHKTDSPYRTNDYCMWWQHGCIVGNDRRQLEQLRKWKRTWESAAGAHFESVLPRFEMQIRLNQLERDTAEHKAKIDFLKSKGLTVGTMKEAGKEPYLAYAIEHGSELDVDHRWEQEAGDLQAEVAKLTQQLAESKRQLDKLRADENAAYANRFRTP
jgi:hypothetical protein